MKEQLLATLENSRKYTMQTAQLMPEEFYSFKLTKSSWNFGELLHHIAYGIQWWGENYLKGIESSWAPPAITISKKQIIGYLDSAYKELQNTIRESEINDNFIRGFYATLDHITHHRGQAVMHLRGQGITPPEYTY